MIRAHGVPQETMDSIAHQHAVCSDATCPFVTKIHKIMWKKKSAKGQTIIIIGDAKHPEIIGNTWTLQQQMLYCKQCAGAAKFVRIRAKFGQSAD